MKKMILVAMIAILLVGGMVLVSCNTNCPGDGKCDLLDFTSGSQCYYGNDKNVKDCMPGLLDTKCKC